MKIEIKNIEYDLEGMMGFECYEPERTREAVLAELPTTIDADFDFDDDDLEEGEFCQYAMRNILEQEIGWMIVGFDYKKSTGCWATFSCRPVAQKLAALHAMMPS